MDDANISDQPPATSRDTKSTQQLDRDRLKSISEACSVIKDEIASTAQYTVGSGQQLGKPPTIAEACSVMKGEIDDEARQILAIASLPVKAQTLAAACESFKAEIPQIARQIVPDVQPEPSFTRVIEGAGDTEERFDGEDTEESRFYLHPIEQAQKAILEAQWFEQ